MFVVVSYDITSDQRRNKIANILKDYGVRVQYSVFECILKIEKYNEMVERILKVFNNLEDTIRIYYICKACKGLIKVYGTGKITEDKEIYIV